PGRRHVDEYRLAFRTQGREARLAVRLEVFALFSHGGNGNRFEEWRTKHRRTRADAQQDHREARVTPEAAADLPLLVQPCREREQHATADDEGHRIRPSLLAKHP